MTRDEFMKEARETAHKILESKENGIMNLVQQAWAEGKRNAELEVMTELVKQALEKAQQSAPTYPGYPWLPTTITCDSSKSNVPESHYKDKMEIKTDD